MTQAAMSFAPEREIDVTVLPPLPPRNVVDEINHRIANSLQLLSAMVVMEARAVADPAALAALDMTGRRIAAIASVHRQLYQTRLPETVDLGAYLDDLGADLERACAHTAAGRRVRVDATPVNVEAADATAIGIIVSELVTNACKYAYAPGQPGDVRIRLHAMPFGGYELAVEDRGRGLSAGPHSRGTGFGALLVEMMAARLGGRCEYHDGHPGARFVLSIGCR